MATNQPNPASDCSLTPAELNADSATNAAIGIYEAHKGHAPIDLPWKMNRDEDVVRHLADTLHLAASMGLINAKRLTQVALDLYMEEAKAEVTQGLTGEPIKCLKCGDTPDQRLTRWFVLCRDCDPKPQ